MELHIDKSQYEQYFDKSIIEFKQTKHLDHCLWEEVFFEKLKRLESVPQSYHICKLFIKTLMKTRSGFEEYLIKCIQSKDVNCHVVIFQLTSKHDDIIHFSTSLLSQYLTFGIQHHNHRVRTLALSHLTDCTMSKYDFIDLYLLFLKVSFKLNELNDKAYEILQLLKLGKFMIRSAEFYKEISELVFTSDHLDDRLIDHYFRFINLQISLFKENKEQMNWNVILDSIVKIVPRIISQNHIKLKSQKFNEIYEFRSLFGDEQSKYFEKSLWNCLMEYKQQGGDNHIIDRFINGFSYDSTIIQNQIENGVLYSLIREHPSDFSKTLKIYSKYFNQVQFEEIYTLIFNGEKCQDELDHLICSNVSKMQNIFLEHINWAIGKLDQYTRLIKIIAVLVKSWHSRLSTFQLNNIVNNIVEKLEKPKIAEKKCDYPQLSHFLWELYKLSGNLDLLKMVIHNLENLEYLELLEIFQACPPEIVVIFYQNIQEYFVNKQNAWNIKMVPLLKIYSYLSRNHQHDFKQFQYHIDRNLKLDLLKMLMTTMRLEGKREYMLMLELIRIAPSNVMTMSFLGKIIMDIYHHLHNQYYIDGCTKRLYFESIDNLSTCLADSFKLANQQDPSYEAFEIFVYNQLSPESDTEVWTSDDYLVLFGESFFQYCQENKDMCMETDRDVCMYTGYYVLIQIALKLKDKDILKPILLYTLNSGALTLFQTKLILMDFLNQNNGELLNQFLDYTIEYLPRLLFQYLLFKSPEIVMSNSSVQTHINRLIDSDMQLEIKALQMECLYSQIPESKEHLQERVKAIPLLSDYIYFHIMGLCNDSISLFNMALTCRKLFNLASKLVSLQPIDLKYYAFTGDLASIDKPEDSYHLFKFGVAYMMTSDLSLVHKRFQSSIETLYIDSDAPIDIHYLSSLKSISVSSHEYYHSFTRILNAAQSNLEELAFDFSESPNFLKESIEFLKQFLMSMKENQCKLTTLRIGTWTTQYEPDIHRLIIDIRSHFKSSKPINDNPYWLSLSVISTINYPHNTNIFEVSDLVKIYNDEPFTNESNHPIDIQTINVDRFLHLHKVYLCLKEKPLNTLNLLLQCKTVKKLAIEGDIMDCKTQLRLVRSDIKKNTTLKKVKVVLSYTIYEKCKFKTMSKDIVDTIQYIFDTFNLSTSINTVHLTSDKTPLFPILPNYQQINTGKFKNYNNFTFKSI
ncbi:hypothetical protein DLAC_03227 [Tieghemostelium lacteum]|uniref:Uncharacterized protein n=1 Tax=Tieghemostelium lacteum TaxID=361077 RepID=A0A152A1I7_TIELA|nr:hypothetical protein DLAC_03227 [Tieghemostelium lacteum]|eukprot:KYR00080.1 hypothetical protein DLAC_03227 [Tieghemostelium lacteum]